VTFFFVTYVFICSIVLLNVVVAVLLDEFISSVTREKEEQEREQIRVNNKKKITGCIDTLTKTLTTFEDEEDLISKIDEIYDRLDMDGSGGLNFDEFRAGIKTLPGCHNVHVTLDDFELITEHGRWLTEEGEFGKDQFRSMMNGELRRYSARELVNVLAFSEGDEFKSTVIMLKLMDTKLSTAILHSEQRILRALGQEVAEGQGDALGQSEDKASDDCLAASHDTLQLEGCELRGGDGGDGDVGAGDGDDGERREEGMQASKRTATRGLELAKASPLGLPPRGEHEGNSAQGRGGSAEGEQHQLKEMLEELKRDLRLERKQAHAERERNRQENAAQQAERKQIMHALAALAAERREMASGPPVRDVPAIDTATRRPAEVSSAKSAPPHNCVVYVVGCMQRDEQERRMWYARSAGGQRGCAWRRRCRIRTRQNVGC
jgi:hypothetical protein